MNKSQMGEQIRYLDGALKECEAENDKFAAALRSVRELTMPCDCVPCRRIREEIDKVISYEPDGTEKP